MKKLQYIFLSFLFLLTSVTAYAQSEGLTIKRFEDVSSVKQYARTQPRMDNNGEHAALVLVQVLTDAKVDFAASYLLGDVELKASEYWVYMAEGAKSLEVHCLGYEKLDVVFKEISNGTIPSLTSKCTYELVINVPDMAAVTRASKQFFKFRVTPQNAVVKVWEGGQQQILPMKEGGVASKMFNYGTYKYQISADRYHTQEGTFTVSNTPGEKTIALLPQFGYITVTGDNIAQGAYVFATNRATGGMTQLGTIPLNKKELDAGTYTIQVQQEKYKDYSTTIIINEGQTTTIRPQLQANFAQLTLTTQSGADILVDGRKLGTGRWSGTLELGEYSVETRQECHRSAYTNITVTNQTAGKTYTLNNPIPMYGMLIVDGTPSDVVVYVDNKKVGVSPLVYSEILIGTHKVRLEKDGYDKQEKSITLTEGQEIMLDYTLAKATAKSPSSSGTSANHQYVDLGLSVKWATCNVGATKPEEYGDYFAWGETKPMSNNRSSTYSYKSNPTTLPLSNDAARVNWGTPWRMPTRAEQDELREKCTWTWTTKNGVKGYKVTSKKNGNFIFLPAAGYRGGSSLYYVGSLGIYWSSSLSAYNSSDAYYLSFSSSYVDWSYSYRYSGRSVRPVCP